MRLARAARHRAFAPFSGFKVGAALLAETGEIVTGCNVESATYGLTMCAERVAIFKAISDGLHEFAALAVVADSSRVSAPCGACRQVLWESGRRPLGAPGRPQGPVAHAAAGGAAAASLRPQEPLSNGIDAKIAERRSSGALSRRSSSSLSLVLCVLCVLAVAGPTPRPVELDRLATAPSSRWTRAAA